MTVRAQEISPKSSLRRRGIFDCYYRLKVELERMVLKYNSTKEW